MGKKREKPVTESLEVDSDISRQSSSKEIQDVSGSKKSKKHKHKKSSKRDRSQETKAAQQPISLKVEPEDTVILEEIDQDISIDDIEMNPMEVNDSPAEPTDSKLLIKTQETPSDKSSLKSAQKSKSEKSKLSSSSKKSNKRKDGSKGEDDTDSEEERWLDAIESGKLEEVDDELKRMKNPRLMTARQRAMFEKRSDGVDDAFACIPAEPLLALPSGFKEKVLTEEMLAKKAIKSKRRREQAQEKREEDKKKTVDRLLKKQDSKISKGGRLKTMKSNSPILTYLDNRDGITISVPAGIEFPLKTQCKREVPVAVLCGVKGCNNLKKYCCSKTGIPLCSLQCYKKNLSFFISQPMISVM